MSVYVKTSSGVTPIANLQEMRHRQYIFIGDSWGNGTSLSNTNDRYQIVLKDMLTKYDSKSKFYLSAVGGAGFAVKNNTFLTQLTTAYTAITGSTSTDITDPKAVTDIIVLGGLNDKGNDPDAISIAIAQFIAVAKSDFPNAKVQVGCIGRSTYFSDNWAVYSVSYRTYHDATLSNGGLYIDGSEWCMHYYNSLQRDYYHPDSTGHKMIARFLFKYLITGKGSFNSQIQSVPAMNNLLMGSEGNRPSVNTSNAVYTMQQDGMITFENVNLIVVGANSGTSLTSNSESCLLNCDINTLGYYGGAMHNASWNSTCAQLTIGYNSGNTWRNVAAIVFPIGNTVNSEFRFMFKILEPSGNTYTNVTQVQIHPFTITVPWYMC